MASRLQALRGWFDARMPTIGAEWRKHAAAYYVPKNLNLWYEFGALAGLVLIIQIVSGIFLYPLSLSRPRLSLYHLGSEAGGPDCR